MKSLTKLGAVILPLALLTACANTSEMEASIAAIQSTADEALAAAKNAQSSADAAASTADSAELAAANAQESADAAQSAVDDQNAKLDRMFEKAMSK